MKKSKSTAVEPPTADAVVAQIAAIESSLNLAPGMTTPEREGQKSLSRNAPDKFIELVADLATQNGGSVAGIPFDAKAALAMLAHVSDAQKMADAATGFATRVTDDAVQGRATVSNEAFAIYRALGRLVRTANGKPYRQKYEEMQRLVRIPRSKKGSNATTTSEADTQTAAGTTPAADKATATPQATTTTPQASPTTAAH